MANPPRLEDLPPHDRRGFFAASLGRLLRPIADYVEQRLPIELPVLRTMLRPPGALPEKDFLETCFRCGACGDACPAHAITQMPETNEDTYGTPAIDPNAQACVICDDLACMKACPSGALKLVDRLEIRIGLALVNHDLCVRSKGESCTECVDRCPLGETAIKLQCDGRVHVIAPSPDGNGCTGCGVCQQYCPTRPRRAIKVHPR